MVERQSKMMRYALIWTIFDLMGQPEHFVKPRPLLIITPSKVLCLFYVQNNCHFIDARTFQVYFSLWFEWDCWQKWSVELFPFKTFFLAVLSQSIINSRSNQSFKSQFLTVLKFVQPILFSMYILEQHFCSNIPQMFADANMTLVTTCYSSYYYCHVLNKRLKSHSSIGILASYIL